ncbi:MAG: helix-turn-helix domain-containing protein [Acutalibacteraceae bacterium]|nr:helix-turn-helix domain-containing protein [Acutalibacteraceae bacterium]
MKQLGRRLKFYRDNCELSQQQVANALNIERSTYTYYETGKTTPSASMLLKISKIFNVPCAVFLECINQELDINSVVSDSQNEKNVMVIRRSGTHEEEKIYNLSKAEKDILVSYRALNKTKQEILAGFLQELISEKE